MKNLFIIITFLYTIGNLYAQPSNNFPCKAIPLTIGDGCNYQTFATNGATRSQIPNPSCGDYTGSNDVWFVVQVPSSGNLILRTAPGTLSNMSMAAYYADNCTSTFTQISCTAGGGQTPNMPGMTLNNLTPGRYIYIRVWDRVCNNIFNCGLPADGYQQGTFQICAQAGYNVYSGGAVNTGSYNCNNTPRAGNTCNEATPICTFDGYCGSTIGYTANYWFSGSRGLGGPLNANGVFCGSIENNSFIKFVAGLTTVDLDVIVSSAGSCVDGVQFMLFGNPTGGPTCQSLDVVNYGCESPMPPGTNRFTGSGLTPGQEYYLMVDGFGGDRCNYQINAISGILTRASAGLDRTICLGDTVGLGIVGAGVGTITWTGPGLISNTGANVKAVPPSTGTFQYVVEAPTLNPACVGRPTDYDTVLVNVIGPASNFNITQSGSCSSDSVSLTASGAFTYLWTPVTGISITSGNSIKVVAPTVPTTYNVTSSNTFGCTFTKQVTISPSGGPILSVSASKDTICTGGSGSILSAAAGFSSYTWSPAGGLSATTGQIVTANPATAGNYTYTVTGTFAGCPNASASVTIRVESAAAVTVTPTSPNICSGQSVTLTAAPAGNYNWTGTGGFSQNNVPAITVSPTSVSTYVATSSGCSNSGSATVSVTPIPPAVSGVDGNRCGTGAVILSSTGNCSGTIRWFDAPTNGNQVGTGIPFTTPTLSNNTIYYVSCTVNNCESPRTAVNANLSGIPPNISVVAAASLSCTTGQVQLSGNSSTPGIGYSWAGPGIISGQSTANPIVNIAGTYTLTVTNPANNCTATADVNVTPNSNQPNANAGADLILNCNNPTLSLNGSSSTSGVTFAWTGPGIVSGANTANPVVNQLGIYTLTVTNTSNGCSSSDQTSVTENKVVPDVSINTPGTLDCTLPSLSLTAISVTPNVTYVWAGPGITAGGNTASPTINTPGTYSVEVTNPINGCKNTAGVNVVGGTNLPDVSIATPSIIRCSNPSINIVGSSTTIGVSFTWAGPSIVGANNSATVVVNGAGLYTLTVTDLSSNCSNTASVSVLSDIVVPVINISAPAEINCTTAQVGISATINISNGTIIWTGPGIVSGQGTPDIIVNAAGNYSITVTNPTNGCNASTNVNVSKDIALPDISISNPGILTCSTDSLILQASSSVSGLSYSWTGPGVINNNNTANPSIFEPGIYIVTVTQISNGCTNSDSVSISESANIPIISVNVSGELSCSNNSVTLSASSTLANSYIWTGPGIVSGGNSAVVTVNIAGNYSVTGTNSIDGCSNSRNVTVLIDTISPSANAGIDTSLNCKSLQITLAGTSSSGTYTWNGPGIVSGSATANPVINSAGTYTLTVIDPNNGCSKSDNVLVVADVAIPDITIATPGVLDCSTNQLALSASTTILNPVFTWIGPGVVSGSNTSQPLINAAGDYTLTITNPVNGCQNSASVTVTGNPNQPDITFGAVPTLNCLQNIVSISCQSTTSGADFSWIGPGILSGANTATISINLPGKYVVTVSDPSNGCSTLDSVIVALDTTAPILVLSPDDTLTCRNSTLNISAGNSGSNVSYAWTGPGITSNANISAININLPGIYSVIATNTANGCSVSGSINIDQNITLPDATAGIDDYLDCNTGTYTLKGKSNTVGASFSWAGSGITSNPNLADVNVNQAGIYTLTVTDLINGCSTTDQVEIFATSPILVEAQIFENPCIQLQKGAIILTVSGGTGTLSYSWSDGSSRKDITNAFGGSYTVNISDSIGCSFSQTYFIPQRIFEVTAFRDASIEYGDSIEIYGEVNGATSQIIVFWSPSDYLSCTDCFEALAKPFDDIFYVFTATDSNGCSGSDTIFIDVNTDYDLYFPNAITPNRDNLNDVFKALGKTSLVVDYELQVFNRWGEKIFETTNINDGWDGTFNGEPVMQDGYIHHVKATFSDGDKRTYKGIVMVLR